MLCSSVGAAVCCTAVEQLSQCVQRIIKQLYIVRVRAACVAL